MTDAPAPQPGAGRRAGGSRVAVAGLLAVTLLGAACGSPLAKADTQASTTTTTLATGPGSTASGVRSKLNGLLAEHVFLTAAASGAALGGRNDEFTAAAAALDGNTTALTSNMSALLGSDAGASFNALWKKHIGFFVNYAQGLAAKDGARSAQALSDLDGYTQQFGALINSALPALAAGTVAGLVADHVKTLRAVIDDQAAGNPQRAYADLVTTASRVDTLTAPLVTAVAAAQPTVVGGSATSKGADLLTGLSGALRAQVFLVGAQTGAALAGRTAEAAAAGAAVGTVVSTLETILGNAFGSAFVPGFDSLWHQHLSYLNAYVAAVAAKDPGAQDAALKNLLAFSSNFAAYLSKATDAKLATDTLTDLVSTYIFTMKAAIDAQAASNWALVDTTLRTDADQMSLFAAPLALQIVTQFPNQFSG